MKVQCGLWEQHGQEQGTKLTKAAKDEDAKAEMQGIDAEKNSNVGAKVQPMVKTESLSREGIRDYL